MVPGRDLLNQCPGYRLVINSLPTSNILSAPFRPQLYTLVNTNYNLTCYFLAVPDWTRYTWYIPEKWIEKHCWLNPSIYISRVLFGYSISHLVNAVHVKLFIFLFNLGPILTFIIMQVLKERKCTVCLEIKQYSLLTNTKQWTQKCLLELTDGIKCVYLIHIIRNISLIYSDL